MKKLLTLTFILVLAPAGLTAHAADAAESSATKTLVWPDGTRYVGGVVDGKRSGKGTIFWQDGTRFVGQFENDMRNGPGTMILPDGTVYTGFFKNDELIDTEATIAASNAQESVELPDTDLGDTDLPMEADSVSREQLTAAISDQTLPQVDENDLVETTEPEIDSEPEPIAEVAAPVIEPEIEDEPAPAETVAMSEPADNRYDAEADDDPYNSDVEALTESVREELRETIDLWAAAWSDQNVPQYISNYSEDFRVPGRQSRRTWEALRRTRLNRPSYINLDVTYQRFEFVTTNVVDVFFRQAYRSNSYSDLTDKVLRMRKEGTDWKIIIERSR